LTKISQAELALADNPELLKEWMMVVAGKEYKRILLYFP
jgi:hypothetical protein